MAKDKKGFVLYADLIHTVNKMPDDKAGILLKHILSYVNDQNPSTNDMLVELVFEPIKQQLKRDLQKWEEIRVKRSIAGKASADKRQQMSTHVESVQQSSTNPTVIVSDNVTVKDKVKGSVKDKEINKILLSQVDSSTLDDKEKEYFQIAISFWELVKANLNELEIESPTTENATYKTWVDPIRLIIEKDKRTINEFREIFKFLQEDEFWKQQIRSTAKLRKKDKDKITYFEILLIKSRNGRKQKSTDQKNSSGVSDDYKQSVFKRLQHPERQ